jgi:hypothetical protein
MKNDPPQAFLVWNNLRIVFIAELAVEALIVILGLVSGVV